MRLSIKGEDPELKEELRHAMKWFLNRLLSPKIIKNLSIFIDVKQGLYKDSRYKGSIVWRDSNHRPRSFYIDLDKDLTKTVKINVLAHECVHLKQFVEGYLKDLYKPEITKWYDSYIDSDKLSYRKHPWEIEARAVASIISKEYRKSLKGLP